MLHKPYSYKQCPEVPDFNDDTPIVFMDGDCVLCTTGARIISRLDHKQEFRICRVQTPLGRAVLKHFNLDADDPESWLYLVDGRAYTSLDAITRVGARLGGMGWSLQVLRILPRSVQNWLYVHLARNRYRLFGRADMCSVPSPALRSRLME